MPLYNSNYLKQISRTKTISESSKLFSERNQIHNSFDIFLSHSYLDKEIVEGLYLELTRMGFSVYVDWIIDPNLNRNEVSKESAELIRSKMKSSKSLLLAISSSAKLSKWIPWELGYIDGRTQSCALVPIEENSKESEAFHRSEYLKLYPYVTKKDLLARNSDLYAIEDSNNYVELKGLIMENRKPTYKSFSLY